MKRCFLKGVSQPGGTSILQLSFDWFTPCLPSFRNTSCVIELCVAAQLYTMQNKQAELSRAGQLFAKRVKSVGSESMAESTAGSNETERKSEVACFWPKPLVVEFLATWAVSCLCNESSKPTPCTNTLNWLACEKQDG